MHTIHLHGAAAERFGGPFRMDVRDAPEAIRAIAMQRADFLPFLRQAHWRVIRGPLEKGAELDEQSFGLAIGRAGEIHLIPVPAGSVSGKGVGKIIAGIGLVALSFTGVGALAGGAIGTGLFGLGVSVGLAGISQVLAKTPVATDINEFENQPASKLFNGTGPNLTEPGHPYPLALGRIVRTGSVVAQIGLTTEQLL
jgi:predicted phage tail protein